MKNLFKCVALCILLSSCKKDVDKTPEPLDQPNAESFEVTFNVSEFEQEVTGASRGNSISDAPLKDFADFFTYIAYNADGEEVSRIKQDLSSGNATRINNPQVYPDRPTEEFAGQQVFGCIKDSLTAGEYTIVMVASKKEFSINNRNENTLDYTFNLFAEASFYYNRGLDSWSRAEDTFFKEFPVTVEEQDSQHNVILDRIVGKAEINILDSKPNTSYKFLFVNENEAFKFSNEKPFSSTSDLDNEEYLQAVLGEANLSYSKFLLNTETPLDVIIKVFENGELSATKTVEDVRFYKNKRTILTGNIYTQKANTTGFTVTVNDEFDADSVVVSF